ncbi:MAG: hypothetical protein LCI02_19150 [Proteobacteria bacterium]|nr:hypothetical protein [Pseudomonadota bacterium]
MPEESNFESGPGQYEEMRLLAEAFSGLQSMVAVIVEHRLELLPGEAADELSSAWNCSQKAFSQLAQELRVLADTPRSAKAGARRDAITHTLLEDHQLLGPVGHAKRSLLGRLRSAFYEYWNSIPRTDEKRHAAAHFAIETCEAGASIAGSIGGALGGAVEEALLLIKQSLSVRLQRGH